MLDFRSELLDEDKQLPLPSLRIVFLIVGTHGDVLPFLGLCKRLIADGHRVRLATHAVHRALVLKHDIEFYPLGGDPRVLCKWAVESGGTVLGELSRVRPAKLTMLKEICHSLWDACTKPDPYDPAAPAFVAEAIVANPPTFGHIHVAEALGCPLHMMFPQPWTETVAFPHPMSGLTNDNEPGRAYRNWGSYHAVDMSMWLGNAMMINSWRRNTLHLRPIRTGTLAGNLLTRLHVPFSYMWSPSFVPKPADWPYFVDVVGAFTTDQVKSGFDESRFAALSTWLSDGAPPIFVGFGSMVIEDPKALARMIMAAADGTGVRVLVQSNWSKIEVGSHPSCFDVGPCPHDWLLPQVGAVVHHGGAGTTAAGLRYGKPTLVCPFFGDQYFWGEMVYRSGAGPKPCPISKLTAPELSAKFHQLASDVMVGRARALAEAMNAEDGIARGFEHLLQCLPRHKLLCDASLLLDPPELVVATFNLEPIGPNLVQLALSLMALGGGIAVARLTWDYVRDGLNATATETADERDFSVTLYEASGWWILLLAFIYGLTSCVLTFYLTELIKAELFPDVTMLKVSSELTGTLYANPRQPKSRVPLFWRVRRGYYPRCHASKLWDTSHVHNVLAGVISGGLGGVSELLWGLMGLVILPDRWARSHGLGGALLGIVWAVVVGVTVRPVQAVLLLVDRIATGMYNKLAYAHGGRRPRAFLLDPLNGFRQAALDPPPARLEEVQTFADATSDARAAKLLVAFERARVAKRVYNSVRFTPRRAGTWTAALRAQLSKAAVQASLGLSATQASRLCTDVGEKIASSQTHVELISFSHFLILLQRHLAGTASSRRTSPADGPSDEALSTPAEQRRAPPGGAPSPAEPQTAQTSDEYGDENLMEGTRQKRLATRRRNESVRASTASSRWTHLSSTHLSSTHLSSSLETGGRSTRDVMRAMYTIGSEPALPEQDVAEHDLAKQELADAYVSTPTVNELRMGSAKALTEALIKMEEAGSTPQKMLDAPDLAVAAISMRFAMRLKQKAQQQSSALPTPPQPVRTKPVSPRSPSGDDDPVSTRTRGTAKVTPLEAASTPQPDASSSRPAGEAEAAGVPTAADPPVAELTMDLFVSTPSIADATGASADPADVPTPRRIQPTAKEEPPVPPP